MELATFTMLSSTLLHQEFTHSTSSAGAGVGKEGSATAIPVCPNETPEADRVDYLGGDPAAEAAAAMGVDRTDASRGRGNHISMKLAAASRGKGAKRSGAKAKAKRAAQEKPVDLSKVSFVFYLIFTFYIILFRANPALYLTLITPPHNIIFQPMISRSNSWAKSRAIRATRSGTAPPCFSVSSESLVCESKSVRQMPLSSSFHGPSSASRSQRRRRRNCSS